MSELPLRALDDTALSVAKGGVELLRYTYAPSTPQLESPKPFLHPIRTRSGRLVSLFRPHDHVWHKGIAWSLPVVGEENFWGGPTYVHGQFYVQLDNDGSQLPRGSITSRCDGYEASLAHDVDWVTRVGSYCSPSVDHLVCRSRTAAHGCSSSSRRCATSAENRSPSDPPRRGGGKMLATAVSSGAGPGPSQEARSSRLRAAAAMICADGAESGWRSSAHTTTRTDRRSSSWSTTPQILIIHRSGSPDQRSSPASTRLHSSVKSSWSQTALRRRSDTARALRTGTSRMPRRWRISSERY